MRNGIYFIKSINQFFAMFYWVLQSFCKEQVVSCPVFTLSLIDARLTSFSKGVTKSKISWVFRSQSNYPNRERECEEYPRRIKTERYWHCESISTTKWEEKAESSCISQRITSFFYFLSSSLLLFLPRKALSSFVFSPFHTLLHEKFAHWRRAT